MMEERHGTKKGEGTFITEILLPQFIQKEEGWEKKKRYLWGYGNSGHQKKKKKVCRLP